MTILIMFHMGGFRCLKHFYVNYICKHCSHLFPRTVSYNRFVELEKKVAVPLLVFVKEVLLGKCTGVNFVDCFPVSDGDREKVDPAYSQLGRNHEPIYSYIC